MTANQSLLKKDKKLNDSQANHLERKYGREPKISQEELKLMRWKWH